MLLPLLRGKDSRDLQEEREELVLLDKAVAVTVAVVGGLETVAASEASVLTAGGNMLKGGGARGPLLLVQLLAELLLLPVLALLVMRGNAVDLIRCVSTALVKGFCCALSLLLLVLQ